MLGDGWVRRYEKPGIRRECICVRDPGKVGPKAVLGGVDCSFIQSEDDMRTFSAQLNKERYVWSDVTVQSN